MKDDNSFYKIRAHHGMCLAFFQGKGYSDEFAKHMAEVKRLLETNPPVCITKKADIICDACPNNREGVCTSSELVAEYDRQVLLRCELQEETVMPFLEFQKMVYDSILIPGKREEICGNCEWSSLCQLTSSEV